MNEEDNRGPVATAATDRYALAIVESDLRRVMLDLDELEKRNAVPAEWNEARTDISLRCMLLANRIRERIEDGK